MENEKSIVVTVFGHKSGQNRVIDKIAVSILNKKAESSHRESSARAYCRTMNELNLQGDAWVFSKIISENTQYALAEFYPLRFDCILKLENRAIQKMLREVDSCDLAVALKGTNEAIQEKVFTNLSKNAACMLKEDMEFMGPILINRVKEEQEKILDVILKLEQLGIITIPDSAEDIIV